MISLYSGTPGSGKSLHVAQKIMNWLRSGKYAVIANFEINYEMVNYPEYFFFRDNNDLSPDYLIDFSHDWFRDRPKKEGQILLIIDEAQLMFNVREWNLKGREKWIHFFTQHRKLGFDVIIVAQFDKMIDKQLRSLFEYEVIHRKISNFGIKGKMLSIWSGNRLFFAVKMWYPLREKCGHESFHYTKKLGEFYDTEKMFTKPTVPEKHISEPENGDIEFIDIN